MSTTVWGVLSQTHRPLHGLCPVCDQPFDEGCRIVRAWEVFDAVIVRVLGVACCTGPRKNDRDLPDWFTDAFVD